jgi:hypothetical protein
MNQKIRTLAEQAGFDYFVNRSEGSANNGREYCQAWTEQLEEFARLLLEEYDEQLREARRGIKANLGHNRIFDE